jgi:hypothetical protein
MAEQIPAVETVETEYSSFDPPFYELPTFAKVRDVRKFIKRQVKSNFSAMTQPIAAMFETVRHKNGLSIFATEIFATESAETLVTLGRVIDFELNPNGSDRTDISATCFNPMFADYFESLWKKIEQEYQRIDFSEDNEKPKVAVQDIAKTQNKPWLKNELSPEEVLCLQWVERNERNPIPHMNMSEFLDENSPKTLKSNFKRMLKECGKKGLIKKGKNMRWRLIPD